MPSGNSDLSCARDSLPPDCRDSGASMQTSLTVTRLVAIGASLGFSDSSGITTKIVSPSITRTTVAVKGGGCGGAAKNIVLSIDGLEYLFDFSFRKLASSIVRQLSTCH